MSPKSKENLENPAEDNKEIDTEVQKTPVFYPKQGVTVLE